MQQLQESGPWPVMPVNGVVTVDEPTFTISDLAREFGVSLRTLRFYESRSLLSPRRNGRVRLYSQGDRERLALILRGKKLGFPLDDIRGMLDEAQDGAAPTALNVSREKCAEQINLLEARKRQIETALAELRLAYAGWDGRAVRRREVEAV